MSNADKVVPTTLNTMYCMLLFVFLFFVQFILLLQLGLVHVGFCYPDLIGSHEIMALQ